MCKSAKIFLKNQIIILKKKGSELFPKIPCDIIRNIAYVYEPQSVYTLRKLSGSDSKYRIYKIIEKEGFLLNTMNTKIAKFTNTFIEKNKHAVLLLYFPLYLAGFTYLEKTVTTHFHVIHTALDDYIPFCEYFIIPYLLWFCYVAWGVAYFYFRNKDEYFRLCTALFIGMTVFLIVSYLYPNGHYLRPVTFDRNNIFIKMVKQLYSTDTSTNLFPSIHVYNSIVVNFSVWHSKNFKEKKAVRYGSSLLMISIVLSTMFLKQHSVFDVITGILMAAVVYRLVYGVNALRFSARERKNIRNPKKIAAKSRG